MLHRELLVDGVFLGGVCDQGIGKQVVRSPWDGAIVGTAAESGWPEVDAALDAAQSAFKKHRFDGRDERRALLRRIAENVRNRQEELAELLVSEIAKPITMAQAEVARMALTFDLAAALLEEPARSGVSLDFDPRGKDYEAWFEREPIGVVYAIVPYNWPYNLAAHKLAPALAAGCSVVLKGSPLAPLSTLTLARLIHEAGCPNGLLNAVHCDSATAERAALDPRVDMVSFTGSAAVGWHLKKLCWDKPVALELGGNASAIVCPSADLGWAAERLSVSAFGYAGQVCISAQHVWVHQSIYKEFIDNLVLIVQAIATGDPRSPNTVCGPLISADAAERLSSWIDEAVSAGCRLLVGGEQQGAMVPPTLIEAPAIEDRMHPAFQKKLFTEEAFGPVLTIGPFRELGEVAAHVNSSKYGLHASVFSKDEDEIERCFRVLEVGGAVANDFPTLRFDNMPYGGNKQSGFGREGVRFAFEEMTRPKSLVSRRMVGGR